MAVRKRTWETKSGTRSAWVVAYRDAAKNQLQETFQRERDAKAWEARMKVDLEKGTHQPDRTSKTITQAGVVWLSQCEQETVEPEAIAKYRQHLRLHMEPATAPENLPNAWIGKFGDLKLSRLTGPVCEAFRLAALSSNKRNRAGEIIPGRTISRRTAQHVWTSFKSMLNVAVRHGLIPYNPAQKMRLDTKNREKIRIRIGEQIPDRPDVRAIIAASTGVWHVFFSTASFSGLRSSELRAVAWPQIDFSAGTIEVCRRADWKGQIGPCKSGSAKRTVQIPDHLVDQFRCWKLICSASHEQLVFPNDAGNVICRSEILKQLQAIQRGIYMKRSDGKPKYTVHSLRHFYASIMIAEGVLPKRIQELLGHSTLAMTMDTYGHLFPESEVEKNRINNAYAAVLMSGTQPTPALLDFGTTTETASVDMHTANPNRPTVSAAPENAIATRPLARLVRPPASSARTASLERKLHEVGAIDETALTEAQWAAVQRVLPQSRSSDRRIIGGIWWAHRTGRGYRKIPDAGGKWTTFYNRYRKLEKVGLWGGVVDALTSAAQA